MITVEGVFGMLKKEDSVVTQDLTSSRDTAIGLRVFCNDANLNMMKASGK